MPDEQKNYSGDQENDAQSPESTEIAKLQTELLKTHQAAEAIIQDLKEFKKYLIPNLDEDASQISLESALNQVPSDEQLQQNTEDDGLDWEALNQALSRLVIKGNMLNGKISKLNDRLSQINSNLENLHSSQENRSHEISSTIKNVFLGIKEIGKDLSKQHLESRKLALDQQLTIINEAIRKTEQCFLNYIEKRVNQFVKIWENHTENVARASWVNEEITQVFITNKILPVVEKEEQGGLLSSDEKNNFLADLSDYIETRNVGDDTKKDELQTKLRDFIHTHHTPSNLKLINLLEHLVNQKDLYIVKQMTSHLACEQLSELKEDFFINLADKITPQFYENLKAELKLSEYSRNSWKPKSLFDSEKVGVDLADFDLLKKSETAQAIFGPLIKKLDEHFYRILLNDSFANDISEGLIYYPTPDAIKTIVINAAADEGEQTYRIYSANNILSSWAKRDDWEMILDHAIKSYPELIELKSLLLNWDYIETGNHEDIKQQAYKLVASVINDESENQELRKIAQRSLPNDVLAAEMANNDVISQEDAASYQQSYNFLFKLAQYDGTDYESPEAHQAHHFNGRLFNWDLKVRSLLKKLDQVNRESDKYVDLLDNFRCLIHLGEIWREVQDDHEKLLFLTSYNAINIAAGSSDNLRASQEELTFLKEAYDLYPIFKDENNDWILGVLSSNPTFFLNESGMSFLQNFFDLYQDSGTDVRTWDRIIKLIAKSKLDPIAEIYVGLKTILESLDFETMDIIITPAFVNKLTDEPEEAVNIAIKIDQEFPQLVALLQGPLKTNNSEVVNYIFNHQNPEQIAQIIETTFSKRVPYWVQLYMFTESLIGEELSKLNHQNTHYPVTYLPKIALPNGEETFIDLSNNSSINIAKHHQFTETAIAKLTLEEKKQLVTAEYQEQVTADLDKIPFSYFLPEIRKTVWLNRLRKTVEFTRDPQKKELATQRNREFAKTHQDYPPAGSFVHAAPLYKGGNDVFELMSSVGNLPRGALGVNSQAVNAAWETDCSLLIPEKYSKGIESRELILSTISAEPQYGGWDEMGVAGQAFYVYERGPDSYDAEVTYQPEGESTGHVRVLGGIPETERSAVVVREPDAAWPNNPELTVLEKLKRSIVENGWWYPVYDLDWNQLFTYEEYQELREDENHDQVEVPIWDFAMSVEGPTGSNPGQWFLVEGEQHYAKLQDRIGYEAQAKLWNEWLADEIYRLLEVPVPTSKIVKIRELAQYARSSLYIEGEFSANADIDRGFIADCLLANWDVPYAVGRNVIVDQNGTTQRFDNGGALLFHAKDSRRKPPGAFNETVLEIERGVGTEQLGLGMRHRYFAEKVAEEQVNLIEHQCQVLRERLTRDWLENKLNETRLNTKDREKLFEIILARKEYILQNQARILQ